MKLLIALAACAAAQQLELELSEDGTFEIALDGVAWLRGGDVMVDGRSAAAGDFTLAARTHPRSSAVPRPRRPTCRAA